MTDGMRRPPRLWEQKLEGMIRVAGVTGFGSAGSSVVSPGPTPGPDGPGSEPAPPPVVDPDPSTPRIPSTPVVAGTTLGLTVIWDGKDTAGVLFPKGTTVEVHVSGTTGFTPSSGTLKGAIAEAGGSLLVGGIAAGSTFFVKFIAVYADGQKSDPSAQGSAMVGLVQGPEINGDAVITQIVSATTPATTFKLGSIWINTTLGTYNVLESVGGTPTWVKKEWKEDAIAANAISANQIAAQAITTKFLTGEIIRTGATPSARIEISATNGIEVFRDATNKTFWAKPSGEVVFGTTSVSSGGVTVIDGGSISTGTINANRIDTAILRATDVGSGGTTVISGDRIATGTVAAARIDVDNLVVRKLSTRATGTRVRISDDVSLPYGTSDAIEFFGGSTSRVAMAWDPNDAVFDIHAPYVLMSGRNGGDTVLDVVGKIEGDTVQLSGAFYADGSVAQFGGAYDLATDTGADIVLNTNKRLRRKSSTQRVKYDITLLSGTLHSGSVDAAKLSDVDTTGNLHNVLDCAVVEFSPITEDEPVADRYVGFIAEDVVEKFPGAIMFSPVDGSPEAVRVDAIVAALVAVARGQRATIADLTARIESLEANQG